MPLSAMLCKGKRGGSSCMGFLAIGGGVWLCPWRAGWECAAVYDTVRLHLISSLPFSSRCRWPEEPQNLPDGWAWCGRKDGRFPEGYRSSPQYGHTSGIRIIGSSVPRSVEFSLPRVLFGSNGRQLRDQGQVDSALALALSRVRQILPHAAFGAAIRIDLARNFPMDTTRLSRAIGRSTHPRLRKPVDRAKRAGRILPRLDGSMTWKGATVSTSCYSKPLEMGLKGGPDVARVELRLNGGPVVKRMLGDDALNFARAWNVYRSWLNGFHGDGGSVARLLGPHLPEDTDQLARCDVMPSGAVVCASSTTPKSKPRLRPSTSTPPHCPTDPDKAPHKPSTAPRLPILAVMAHRPADAHAPARGVSMFRRRSTIPYSRGIQNMNFFKLKLPPPPLTTGKPTDRFAVVGPAPKELRDGLATLMRAQDKPHPIITRSELALLNLSPVALCYRRVLSPMQEGPEAFGLTAEELAKDVLGEPGKDATRPLARALDFASAIRRRSQGRAVVLALAPRWEQCPASAGQVFDEVKKAIKVTPACLLPLLEELQGSDDEREGGRELARRLLLGTPVETFAGKVARDAMPTVVALLNSPQVPPVYVKLCDLVTALEPPRTLDLWRALRHLTTDADDTVRASAERALFTLG